MQLSDDKKKTLRSLGYEEFPYFINKKGGNYSVLEKVQIWVSKEKLDVLGQNHRGTNHFVPQSFQGFSKHPDPQETLSTNGLKTLLTKSVNFYLGRGKDNNLHFSSQGEKSTFVFSDFPHKVVLGSSTSKNAPSKIGSSKKVDDVPSVFQIGLERRVVKEYLKKHFSDWEASPRNEDLLFGVVSDNPFEEGILKGLRSERSTLYVGFDTEFYETSDGVNPVRDILSYQAFCIWGGFKFRFLFFPRTGVKSWERLDLDVMLSTVVTYISQSVRRVRRYSDGRVDYVGSFTSKHFPSKLSIVTKIDSKRQPETVETLYSGRWFRDLRDLQGLGVGSHPTFYPYIDEVDDGTYSRLSSKPYARLVNDGVIDDLFTYTGRRRCDTCRKRSMGDNPCGCERNCEPYINDETGEVRTDIQLLCEGADACSECAKCPICKGGQYKRARYFTREVTNSSGVFPPHRFRVSREMRRVREPEDVLDVTLVSHYGVADLSAFSRREERFDPSVNADILRHVSSIQGGLVSTGKGKGDKVDVKELFIDDCTKNGVNHGTKFCVRLTVRDTMAHAVAGSKSLKSLGELVADHTKWEDFGKLDVSQYYKENMNELFEDDFDLFCRYSMVDSEIVVYYLAMLYGLNRHVPVTVTSLAGKLFKDSYLEYAKGTPVADHLDAVADFIADNLGGLEPHQVSKRDRYDYLFRGVCRERLSGVVEDSTGRVRFISDEKITIISRDAQDVLDASADAYIGGYNSCFTHGWVDTPTVDYDLKNAYPTAMSLIPMLDYRNPIKRRLDQGYEFTLDDFDGGKLGTRWYVGDVTFDFKDAELKTHPVFAIATRDVGSVYPLRYLDGDSSIGVKDRELPFCGTFEIYTALKMGARVYAGRVYELNVIEGSDVITAEVLKGFVETRDNLKNRGHHVLQLLVKTLTNSIYGNVAMNISPKRRYVSLDREYADADISVVSEPFFASHITSLVRCTLLSAMAELTALGHIVHSVTTDGFITDAPEDVVYGLDMLGFKGFLEISRLRLTDDPTIWEPKHRQDCFFNGTTRLNISPDGGGVCAHGGYVTGEVKDSVADRRKMIELLATRGQDGSNGGNLVQTDKRFPTLAELVNYDKERRLPDFLRYDITKQVNVNFDYKNKPTTWESVSFVPFEGSPEYTCAYVTTSPYETLSEFRKYRKVKKNRRTLTVEDYDSIKRKYETDGRGGYVLTETPKSRLMDVVKLHTSGRYVIREFLKPANPKSKSTKKQTYKFNGVEELLLPLSAKEVVKLVNDQVGEELISVDDIKNAKRKGGQTLTGTLDRTIERVKSFGWSIGEVDEVVK